MKLSIILPVYNVEKFIPDCLESLEAQDLPKEEYEIICVDDGSPDNAAQVIQEYQNKYPNIRLIRQENGGVCAARNNGFKEATGEYVWFIDPDDYIQVNCLGCMLDALYAQKADLIVFEYAEVQETAVFNKEVHSDIAIEPQKNYAAKGSACQYICRRTYLVEHNIVFNGELAYGEDYLWAFQVNYRKHMGLVTDAVIYFYRQRESSAMHSKTREKQFRHMNDMQKLAQIYEGEYLRCEKEGLPKDALKAIKRRKDIAVQSVIVDLIMLADNKTEVLSKLNEIKNQGLYPYSWTWWNLFEARIQGKWVLKLAMLPAPIRGYVIFLNWLYRTVKK